MLRHTMMMAAAGRTTPQTFSPLSIPWASAYWASDPDWTPPGDGNPVSSWRDAGTNGANATGSGSTRPIYRSAGLNGQPSLDFDGTDDVLVSGAIASPAAAPWTGVIVFRGDDEADAQYLVDNNASSSRLVLLYRGPDDDYVFGDGTTNAISAGGQVHTSPHIAICALDADGNLSLELDGVEIASASDGGSNGVDYLRIGQSRGIDFEFDGDYAFLGVIGRVLTAQERSDCLSWAQSFYGVGS